MCYTEDSNGFIFLDSFHRFTIAIDFSAKVLNNGIHILQYQIYFPYKFQRCDSLECNKSENAAY